MPLSNPVRSVKYASSPGLHQASSPATFIFRGRPLQSSGRRRQLAAASSHSRAAQYAARIRCVRRSITAAFCLTLVTSGANAQSLNGGSGATPFVPPNDAIYEDVVRLRTAGLLPGVVMGQRPYSAGEFARLANVGDSAFRAIREAAGQPDATAALRSRAARLAWAQQSIARLAAAGSGSRLFNRESPFFGGGRGEILALQSSSPIRKVPYRGIGYNDGILSTAAEHRAGLLMEEGVVGVAETGLWMGAGPFAISVSTRERLGADDPFHERDVFELHSLSARLVVRNVAVTVGRDQLHWAQGVKGGFALSTNPRPMDQVVLGMERPVRLPWILKYFGPTRATIFLADMGKRQHFPNSRLTGYKISIVPHDRFELGTSMLVQWGGDGSPEHTTGEILRDHLPFLSSRGGGAIEISNKLATMDGRLRLHDGTGFTIYGEIAADDLDKDRKWLGMYEDGAQLVGLRLPTFGPDGRWDFQAEARRTGLRFYNHHQFRSGLTVDGAIIGDPLGPNAMAGGMQLRRGLGETGSSGNVELAFGMERRSYDEWRIVSSPFGFERTRVNPAEWRSRLALGLMLHEGGTYTYRLRIAGERIDNWSGRENVDRYGIVSEIGAFVRF